MHTPTSFAFSTPSESNQGVRYSSSQWDVHRSTVKRLYILENRSALDIVDILSKTGFFVTEKQLKDRLRRWGFNTKNVKESEMLEIARLRLKRKNISGKSSAFVIKKTQKSVKGTNIDRFLKRKNISKNSLLSMASPVHISTPCFDVLTPPASSLEDVDENLSQADTLAAATLLHSPTPILQVAAYPTWSSLSYYENPENRKEHPWSELPINNLELPPAAKGDWIGDNPIPSLGQYGDSCQNFDFSEYDHEFAQNDSSPQTPRCPQVEEESGCREQLTMIEMFYDPDHAETLNAQRNLAFALYKGGQYEPAEVLLHQVVEVGRKSFGHNHMAVLESCLHLSIVIQDQGRYSEAELLQREILATLKESAQEDHKQALQTKLSLAVTLTYQERFDEATHIQNEVLEVCLEKFECKDPLTLQVKGDLALSQVRKGVRNQSVKACQEQWNAWKDLGETHPQTMVTKLLLAVALSEEGNHKGSYALAHEIWKCRKDALGAEHLDTLRVEAHLAFCFDQQAFHGEPENRQTLHEQAENRQALHEQAEEIYRRVWTAKKRILGEAHPDTLQSLIDVALHLQRRHQHLDAEILFTQVLDTRLQARREGYQTHTLYDLSRIATSRLLQQRYRDAELRYREVLARIKFLKVGNHPHIFITEKNAALAVAHQGRGEEATEMLRDTLMRCKKTLGDQHWDSVKIMSAMAGLLRHQNKSKEAEEMLQDTLIRCQKALGNSHLTTGRVMCAMANLLRYQGRLGEAALVFQQLLDVRTETLGPKHPLTKCVVLELANCAVKE